ncbi:5-formyltetrahydrofolate cyclo-ligase [Kocuria varians]|uniref:5-formyltetrahydrofolate cyclo-ligase n=1 Tax=Kocuria varians TaxID=1272 RepID=A0A4Y4D2G9_KOCVA|nr:5-formyltetrahydrofolate cyclo-ligase [Kocuria varians]GEC97934.1 5-formyltetrahydrofolate cyclo-ligase [Kocuria varians]
MDATDGPAAAKARLRTRVLERRRRRPAAARERDAAGFARHLARILADHGPGDVAAFLPLPGEPPVLPALARVDAAGHRVWVPAVEAGHRMSWVRWRPDAILARGALPGLLEPAGPRHGTEVFATVSVLLVPVVAVDRGGVRLGFGGGYYDRFLPDLARAGHEPAVFACCHVDEILPAGTVPREAHDAVLTRALTERGPVRLGS